MTLNIYNHGSAIRPYRQVARAEAFAARGHRIVTAFADCALSQWFDDITLEEVARRARVTVRSVIRRFGGKDGLIAAFIEQLGAQISEEFTGTPGDVDDSVGRLVAVYERVGDGTIRNLAQEPRVPALRKLGDFGRHEHRRITAVQFAPWLERMERRERDRALNALVIATDVYTWKLLRRDMGQSMNSVREQITRLVHAILAEYTP